MDEFLKEFQDKFKHSMRFIYPNGIQNSHHFKDVCKIYYMGSLDTTIRLAENKVSLGLEIAYLIQFGEQMRDFNWWPDDSWKWW